MSLIEKAKKIRLAIFDVDGVLTDGRLYIGNDNVELKAFHVHDGFGIQLLQKSGVTVAIITAKQSDIVSKRMKQLGIHHVYQGSADKLIAYEDLKLTLNLNDEQIAYMGDDLFDLPVLQRVGLSATPCNATLQMHELVHYVTKKEGGFGAARELCEFIMKAQNTYDSLLNHYLEKSLLKNEL